MKTICPHCKQEFPDIPDEYLGKTLECPTCRKAFVCEKILTPLEMAERQAQMRKKRQKTRIIIVCVIALAAAAVILPLLAAGGYRVWKQQKEEKLAAQQAEEAQKQAEETRKLEEEARKKDAETLRKLKEAVAATEKRQLGSGLDRPDDEALRGADYEKQLEVEREARQKADDIRRKNAEQFLAEVNSALRSGGFDELDKDFQQDFVFLTLFKLGDAYDTLQLLNLKDELLSAETVEDFRRTAERELSLEEKENLLVKARGKFWRLRYILLLRIEHRDEQKSLREGLTYLKEQMLKIEQQAFEKVRRQLGCSTSADDDYISVFKRANEKDRAVLQNARDAEQIRCSQFGLKKDCGWEELSRLEEETRRALDDGKLFIPENKSFLHGVSLFPAKGENPYFELADGCLIDPANQILLYAIPNREGQYGIPAGMVAIAPSAFIDCDNLEEITIPKGVTSIGERAFASCHALKEITIPEGVTSIGECAFYGCEKLERVTIPESLTSIGKSAFAYCEALEVVTIQEDVTSIGEKASEVCELMHPGIGERAFYGCKALKKITIPKGITSIGEWAFGECFNLKEVTIPKGITSIGEWAFFGCGALEEITLPEGLTLIGEHAFSQCALEEITIPEGVTSIGKRAFFFCRALKRITILPGIKTIEQGTFYGCGALEEITLPEGLTSIGTNAFCCCEALEEITIPEGVTSIGYGAFYVCKKLEWVTIPEGVTSIGGGAFYGCEALEEITLPESLMAIGKYAFYGCKKLEVVTIPDSVQTIGNSAFKGCPCEKSLLAEWRARTTQEEKNVSENGSLRQSAAPDEEIASSPAEAIFFGPIEGLVFYSLLDGVTDSVPFEMYGDVRFTQKENVPCAYFSGHDGLVFGENILITGKAPCTMSIWAWPTTRSSERQTAFMIGEQSPNAKRALIRHNGRMKFEGFHSSANTDAAMNGEWACYTMTFDGRNAQLYVNGHKVGGGQVSLSTANTFIAIGCIPENNGILEPWTGYLAQAKLYDRVLSQEEIKTLSPFN